MNPVAIMAYGALMLLVGMAAGYGVVGAVGGWLGALMAALAALVLGAAGAHVFIRLFVGMWWWQWPRSLEEVRQKERQKKGKAS